jgi:hypothetical protein
LSGFDALRNFKKHPNGAVYCSAPVKVMALKSSLGIVQLLSSPIPNKLFKAMALSGAERYTTPFGLWWELMYLTKFQI